MKKNKTHKCIPCLEKEIKGLKLALSEYREMDYEMERDNELMKKEIETLKGSKMLIYIAFKASVACTKNKFYDPALNALFDHLGAA